ncbi:MAG: helix-turn-helix domain-containing protein [Alphaproteobacteria bacterium]
MKKKLPNQKHLTEDNRSFIESCLNENHCIVEIARFLSKDPTTISKEIKRNRQYKEPSKFGGYSNVCVNRYHCDITSVCDNNSCVKECRNCSMCNASCKLFKPEICPTLKRAPHVCNGCSKKSSCRLEKFYYRSKDAQSKYESLRTTSREGISLSEDELIALNELTVPLIKKGQPIAHIFSKHKEDIPCTSRTFYSYVEKGYLSLCNIDLRRKVRYKKSAIAHCFA